MGRTDRNHKSGFTLAETLLTVAIIIVLFGLAMIPITKYQKSIRQTELDSKAELVFTAVQNRMVQLQAAGMSELYQPDAKGVQPLGLVPQDAERDHIQEDTLYYVTSALKEQDAAAAEDGKSSAAAALYPEDLTDPELWNGNWVVEFNPTSGSVYAVFYSDEAMAYDPQNFDFLRYRKQRIDNGAKVGYYGGDAVAAAITGELEPRVTIENGEELKVKILCAKQGTGKLHFYVTLRDSGGHSTDRLEIIDGRNGDTVSWINPNYTVEMTLDSLKDGLRFCQQERFQMLTPGSDLRVEVQVTSEDALVDASQKITKTTNSLFAELRGSDTAVIAYGRHLQNLDKGSGVTGTVTKALQTADVQFIGTDSESWDAVYGDLTFQPIDNPNLKAYESTNGSMHPTIYDLPVDTQGDAGLFASFSNGSLRYVRLSGASVQGTGNVGALVGAASGNVEITGCQVYLSRVRDHLADKTRIWLTGQIVGGLVGRVSGGVTITDSFAATVAQGTKYAGGLVGFASGKVTAERSYADSYLYSDNAAGGLIGGGYATAARKLTNCYAAGFLSAPTTAGLIPVDMGDQDSMKNVYTACAPLEGDKLTYAVASLNKGVKLENVFYLCDGEKAVDLGEYRSPASWSGTTNRTEAARILGDAFTAETGGSNTVSYDLQVDLGDYSYPKLVGLTHYGDWLAEFESEALVYYEYYEDGTYGFHGTLVTPLDNTKVVKGDGYGFVYEDIDDLQDTVTVTLGDGTTATLDKKQAVKINVAGKGTYYLLKLPSDIVNAVPADGNFYKTISVGYSTYSFNPLFACTGTSGTVDGSDDTALEISIRTARQLNNLSLYYGIYRESLPGGSAFLQGRGIDYTTYDWANYGRNGQTVTRQAPIGDSERNAFRHIYNGNSYPITGVSIVNSADKGCSGLFGWNAGQLRGVVLTTESGLTVGFSSILKSRIAYVGVLAGQNEGTIYNCAVSGYKISVNSNRSSLDVGGLVGYNKRTIRASSANFPVITVIASYLSTELKVGGLAGGSSGQIFQSYAEGKITANDIKGGGVYLGGFTAENRGTIRSCYTTVALTSANADTYGFSPAEGSLSGCYYLNGGTYAFRGVIDLHDYDGGTGIRGISAKELSQLELSGFGTVTAEHSYGHSATNTAAEAAYPYPSSVRADGQPVHYGDWVVQADLGELGVYYWEHETGGANAGYHISYIGFDGLAQRRDDSLCRTHDDGGVIGDYGYGYYWKDGQEEPTLKTDTEMVLGSEDTTVGDALKDQLPGYLFKAYRTGDDGLRIESADRRNSTWTLTGVTGASKGRTYTYSVCPFFGDAFSYMEGYGIPANGDDVEPGTPASGSSSGQPYEIRSVAQFQYINWSYSWDENAKKFVGSTHADVTGSNYPAFPYLQYSMVTGQNKEKKETVLSARPVQSWKQSHDLNGAGTKGNIKLQPIAGAVYNNNTVKSYAVRLYNWFGGIYDGQSYYIKNVDVDTYCYNVGIFGTTVGAQIRNIVLYSDNDAVIQRSTDYTPSGKTETSSLKVDQYIGSYAVGGLVGIAYDYTDNDEPCIIEECAIAGYHIKDESHNKQAAGEAVVGGLIGVSSVDLERCTAVVDIAVDCTHRYDNENGAMNTAIYGNFVRVGGLVGGLRYKAKDCYTGGKITVGDATLKERVKYNGSLTDLVDGTYTGQIKSASDNGSDGQAPGTYVFIGGVGGSGFAASFQNFDQNSSDPNDGTQVYENCYTYMDFPAMKGTICGITLIGSVADRYSQGAKVEIRNCYYLNSSAQVDFTQLPKYYSKSYQDSTTGWRWTYGSLANILSSNDARMSMLRGDLSYLKNNLWNASKASTYTITNLTGLTYQQMSQQAAQAGLITRDGDSKSFETFKDALNNGRGQSATSGDPAFFWVTNQEKDGDDIADVPGKYSFPGSDTELKGQDYPFPTVLVQEAGSDGETRNLHYGRWPKMGLYWEDGVVELDMITDYEKVTPGRSSRVYELTPKELGTVINGQDVTFSGGEGVAKVVSCRWDAAKKCYLVEVEAISVGSAEILATVEGYTARLLLSVTQQLNVTVAPVSGYVGEEPVLTLTVTDKEGKTITDGLTWSVQSSEPSVSEVSKIEGSSVTLKLLQEGDSALVASVTRKQANGDFTGEAVGSVNVRMQGILGIASTGGDVPLYRQGTMAKERGGWAVNPIETDYAADAPKCGESTLFLYSKGEDADLTQFEITKLTVDGSLSSDSYTITAGEAELDDGYTCIPLTVRGPKAETVKIGVTLRDSRENGQSYGLSIDHAIPASTYTVRFIGEDITESAQTVLAGEKLVLPDAVREGYTFLGWKPEGGGATDIMTAGSEYMPQGDVTLVAEWKQDE